jgi:hypothetical protein
MFTNVKKLYPRWLVGLCLLAALFLTTTVSAAHPDKVNSQQVKVPSPPAFYTFEGELLADVLNAAAATMQVCNCQNRVSHFVYERLGTGSDSELVAQHRLTIYLNAMTPGATTDAIWEIVPFQGTSLPKVLAEAAKYLQNGGCETAVQNVVYQRQTPPPNDQRPAFLHIVYLVLQSPSPC